MDGTGAHSGFREYFAFRQKAAAMLLAAGGLVQDLPSVRFAH